MDATMLKHDLDIVAIKKLLHAMRMPSEIEDIEVLFAEDSTGDPGLYITFRLKTGIQLTPADVQRLTRFTTEATQELIQAGTKSFPYIELQQAS